MAMYAPSIAAAIAPRRGGIHSTNGIYIGGSPLNNDYHPISRITYRYASQRRHPKSSAAIERNLMTVRDSTTSLKFDGQLMPMTGSTTEIGKERFVSMLQRRVEEHGQETFYHIKNADNHVINLFEHAHFYRLEAVVDEFNCRLNSDAAENQTFDSYELDEITLSWLVVESLLSAAFYEKIVIRYSHRADFKDLPSSCLFLMALETCNASTFHDVEGARSLLETLSLDTYPGENISDLCTEAQRLIKIMLGDYALPVNTGSRLLNKVTKTSSEYFNRKMFTLLDTVKEMEHMYKLSDPRALTRDANYVRLGPLGIIATLQEAYGTLMSEHDWPALATKLPQSNNATKIKGEPRENTSHKCFRCKKNHLLKDCPLKKERTNEEDIDAKDTDPAHKFRNAGSNRELSAWKYIEPKDLNRPVKYDDGREWKFCTKCKCRHTNRIGIYQLSHFDSEHVDNYQAPCREGNLAVTITDPNPIPAGPPEFTTSEPEASFNEPDPHEMTFLGMWCTPVETFNVKGEFFSAPTNDDIAVSLEPPSDCQDDAERT